jgi:hypothetical protein
MLISPFSWGMFVHIPATQQKAADAATTTAGGPMVLDSYNASEIARSIADEGWRFMGLARAADNKNLFRQHLVLWSLANQTEKICNAITEYTKTSDSGVFEMTINAILFYTELVPNGLAIALDTGSVIRDVVYHTLQVHSALLRFAEIGRNAADGPDAISNLTDKINGAENTIKEFYETQRGKAEIDNMLGFMRTASEQSGTTAKPNPYNPDINKAVISGNINGAAVSMCSIGVCCAKALIAHPGRHPTSVQFSKIVKGPEDFAKMLNAKMFN